MLDLNEREWREFLFADIFIICGGFYNKKPDARENGSIPFIGATNSNNGITQFCSLKDIETTSKTGDDNNAPLDKKIFKGRCIAVTNNGSVGYAYYQEHDFTCSHDINPLYLKDRELTRNLAHFIITVIERQRVCFTYVHKWRPLRMRKSRIMLPINMDGSPDYAFMEQYIKERECKLIQKYKGFVDKSIQRGGGVLPPNLLKWNEREYSSFFIGDLFTVKRPKARSEKQYKEGKIPFVASGNFNNGVIKCCEPDVDDETLDIGNCITVSPVDGSAFYQDSNFLGRGGAGSSILLLYCENINRYSGLFIAKMIRQTCSKYCYGKMGSQENIKREKIMLPIDKNGSPDYDYMEQYGRSIMLQKYQQYIDYIGI